MPSEKGDFGHEVNPREGHCPTATTVAREAISCAAEGGDWAGEGVVEEGADLRKCAG